MSDPTRPRGGLARPVWLVLGAAVGAVVLSGGGRSAGAAVIGALLGGTAGLVVAIVLERRAGSP